MTTTTDRPATPPPDLVPIRSLVEQRPAATYSRLRTLRRRGQIPVWKLSGRSFVSISDWDGLFDLAARDDEESPTQ